MGKPGPIGRLVLGLMSARRRPTRFPIAASLVVVAAGSLGACGDSSDNSGLLSRASASELRSTLGQVEQTLQNGDCDGAQEQLGRLEQQVASLNSVGADLRDALTSGVNRLEQLVTEECQTSTAETGATGTTGPSGTTDTGGATGPDEQQSDESGSNEGKGQGNKGKEKKDKSQPTTPDEGDESGGSGTTGSGGFAP
jgi:hypothetical protein